MHAIREAHAASYGTYGHRRIHPELVLGVHRRRLRGCTRRDQAATPPADLVDRNLRPAAPDRLYVADIT